MSLKSSRVFKIFSRINLRTVYFNFKYLPIKKAIILPVFISRRCKILSLKGQVEIIGDVSTGLIQIGYGHVGIFDKRYSRSILEINGHLTFQGKCRIGHGSKVSIGKEGHLILGENFSISAESTIVCHKRVKFGNNVLISWEVLIMDTDLHRITSSDLVQINPDREILIGNDVWAGCRCLILKGVSIPDGTIIAANTTITKSEIENKNAIIGGFPIKVLKENVEWHL